jgi:uncharacterized repeat protein (TIGR01451 family)
VSTLRRRRVGRIRLQIERLERVARLLPVAFILAASGAGSAKAAPASPHWSILSEAEPAYFRAGDTSDAYVLIVRNDGALPTTHGSVVTVNDTLPSGVTATCISATGCPNTK